MLQYDRMYQTLSRCERFDVALTICGALYKQPPTHKNSETPRTPNREWACGGGCCSSRMVRMLVSVALADTAAAAVVTETSCDLNIYKRSGHVFGQPEVESRPRSAYSSIPSFFFPISLSLTFALCRREHHTDATVGAKVS